MAALILEVISRHGRQFFPVDKPVTRVGRAFDNDVILSDPSVSPYHFVIRQRSSGNYELAPLADENGIRIGRRRIDENVELTRLPIEFDAGRTRLRIIDRRQPVAPTKLLSCQNGGLCLFGHWGWALTLFAVMLLFSAYNNYLSTPELLTWKSYWSDQFVITSTTFGLSIGLLIVNRITSHRWDFTSALSFTSLALIAAFALDQLTPIADYFFTSELPGYVVGQLWSTLLLPIATAWFLIRLNHGNAVSSWVLIVILFTPSAYIQVKEIAAHYNLFGEFSKKAFYSDSLYPRDMRINKTFTINEFSSNNVLTRTNEEKKSAQKIH